MDAADNAIVAVEELTIHAWDLARAIGQDVQPAAEILDRVDTFFTLFSPDRDDPQGPFGPRATIPSDATHLDRLVAATGRDPRWTGGGRD